MNRNHNRPPDHSVPPTVWLLMDHQAGNRNQCLGVAEALELPFEIRDITYGALGGLPNMMIGATFMALDKGTRDTLVPPWPGLVIAAGRRTAGVARDIKRASNGRTKIVQIMYPGAMGAQEFDLIAVPHHDRVRDAPNFIRTQGAPHPITDRVLMAARTRWADAFEHLRPPRIAVFVGGNTRQKKFDGAMAATFGRDINNMAVQCGGSLLISTSRRTGSHASDALLAEITTPHTVYQWGDSTENPYQGYLGCADAIVVSGDSVSMCSEACAGTGPVYIYAPPGFVTDKHRRMHQTLFAGGYARPFGEPYGAWHHVPLNVASQVAMAIHERLGDGQNGIKGNQKNERLP